VEAVAHGLVRLVVHLQEHHVRVLLGELGDLARHNLSSGGGNAVFPLLYVCGRGRGRTLGCRARQPPQPGEKKSTTTSLSPALRRESARSRADSISRMLGCRVPFSHHRIALGNDRFICLFVRTKSKKKEEKSLSSISTKDPKG
jgi:hypothetical protein